MAKLKTTEKTLLEELFKMGGGYVLDFSDRSFEEFFEDELNVNIKDAKYDYGSGSKANRLRKFWSVESDGRVARSIRALMQYREFIYRDRPDERNENLVSFCEEITARLESQSGVESSLASVLSPLSHAFIDEQIDKCRVKMANDDYSGAITNARTMVETVIQRLADELVDSDTSADGDLLKLYKSVQRELNLDAGQATLDAPLRQILQGLVSVVVGLAAVRNRASDAHAQRYRTHEHHARLAVDAAMTLTNFLLSTYEYQGHAASDSSTRDSS